MKKIKLLFLSLFLLNLGINAQTYCFSSPQGFGAGTTGGGSGPVTIVTTKAQLQTALTASGSGIVIVQGSVQCDYLSVLVTNKTLLGLPGAKLYTNDQTAGASGILNLKPGSNNVIIRNLIFVGPGAYDSDGRDCLTSEATKLWVDHCEFQDGMDGNFDNKGAGDNITVSWCKFTYLKPPKAGGSGGTDDHRFSNLVGSSDSDYPSDGLRNMTWQYCWWAEGCRERMVRARNATLHQLNCYWNSSVTNKAIGLSAGSKGCTDYVESSVFSIPGTVADLSYGGSPKIAFVNCTGGGSNVGTVSKPSYSYEVTPVGSLVSAITNSSCGAGAKLNVTTAGVVSASCGTSNVPVSSVSVSPTSATISVGGTTQLTVTIAPSNATNQSVTWSSSNTSVATVSSSGLVTGVAAGSATITVRTADGGKTATSSIIVQSGSSNVPVSSVSVAPTSATISVGGTTQLTATIAPSNATNKSVTWSSSNTSVASVNSSGLVTGVATGSATITVRTADGGKTATSSITVQTGSLPATLTKHGSGSSSQTITLGTALTSFYYTWANATSVTVTGLPSGASSVINSTDKTVTISGTPTVAGTFNYTITTTGGSPNASVGGTITVNGGSGSTFVYQGENAVINTGVTESTNGGYTGSGYANTDNASGKYVEFTVTTTVAGSFSIFFRYASIGDRPADIYVNGTKVISALAFPTTGAWTSWTNTATKSVTLLNGVNKIRATATTSSGCANLDYLQVSGSGTLKSVNISNAVMAATNKETGLYPNPVKETINISGGLKDKGNVSAYVYNQLGRLVASKNFGIIESGDFNVSFPAGNIKPGLYIMKVKMNGEVKTIPFIKK